MRYPESVICLVLTCSTMAAAEVPLCEDGSAVHAALSLESPLPALDAWGEGCASFEAPAVKFQVGQDGKTYYIGLNETAEQLGRVRRGDLVRVSGGKNGHSNVYLQTRLSLEQQVQSVGRTRLDGKFVHQLSGRGLGDINPRAGMGADVAVQLEARKAVLRERGLLVTDAFSERPVPDLLSKLYAAELADFDHETRGRYGPYRRFTPDVAITGQLQVVDLPSGPHALLRERNGYRITPLRPQMMPFVGQEVSLSLSLEAISRPLDRTTFVRVRAPSRDLGLSR